MALAFLVVHTCVVYLLPVPGCPTGYVGPAGLHDDAKHDPECIGGATGYVDRLVFTSDHIYSNPTPKATYQTTAFDPEGLLGCFSSVFQVFLGYQAGQTVLTFRGHGQRTVRFLAWGAACTLFGFILSGFSLTHGPIPINKNIW